MLLARQHFRPPSERTRNNIGNVTEAVNISLSKPKKRPGGPVIAPREAKEIGEQGGAVAARHALGVELHAMERKRPVPHPCTVASPARAFTARQPGTVSSATISE
jgi:hypothetical protein